MPVYHTLKEEDKKAKARLSQTVQQPVAVPSVPHFLPITRWASQSEGFRSTFIAENGKSRKARLSWYHPDDTMVPRGWWKLGLLEDLKYYAPFSRDPVPTAGAA
jgi:hypothetical protein